VSSDFIIGKDFTFQATIPREIFIIGETIDINIVIDNTSSWKIISGYYKLTGEVITKRVTVYGDTVEDSHIEYGQAARLVETIFNRVNTLDLLQVSPGERLSRLIPCVLTKDILPSVPYGHYFEYKYTLEVGVCVKLSSNISIEFPIQILGDIGRS